MTVTSIEPISQDAPFSQVSTIIVATIGTSTGELSTAQLAKLSATLALPSGVDRAVGCAEIFYAAAKAASAGDARDNLAVACAQFADLCTAYGFHELGSTDRGLKMSGACRRIVGLGTQDESLDPTIRPDLVD